MSDSIRALAYVQKEIEKTRLEQAEFVAAGRAEDFGQYQKVCGVIRGLNLADQIINDLVQKLERE
jgi:hypothetical protein